MDNENVNQYARTKEIGVRKVFGAQDQDLFWVLVKEFVYTYGWAFFLGSLLSWYFATNWLSENTYRVDFNWSNLMIAGLTGLILVLTTLAVQTLKVIQSNPVESLRNE